jgi:hypothetical protein
MFKVTGADKGQDCQRRNPADSDKLHARNKGRIDIYFSLSPIIFSVFARDDLGAAKPSRLAKKFI